jgi:hypothetical protein
MQFDERVEGNYRIYAGALEAPQGDGYVAAVVVSRVDAPSGRLREAYRDIGMSGNHVWRSSADALAYALARARELIRTEPQRLSC